MKKAQVYYTRSPEESFFVGELSELRGRVFFEYSAEFLQTGWDLSPFHLPFTQGLYEHTGHQFGPLPGVFDDSLPDGWGLLLMDRFFRSNRIPLSGVSVIDRLLWLGSRTMGALSYRPSSYQEETQEVLLDLGQLADSSIAILQGSTESILPQLIQNGGSPGGARPKVLIGYNLGTETIISGTDDLPKGFSHWLVKFHSERESQDEGLIETVYAQMAKIAHIQMPDTKIFTTETGQHYFGIRRFDRKGNRRIHTHTFGNLIQSNFRIPSADYADYLKATQLLTEDHQEVLEAFRRMVFNILSHNRDDHVKNFSFLLDDEKNQWRTSPAYDLTFTAGVGGEHTMTIAGEGRQPQLEHLQQLAKQFSLTRNELNTILEETRYALSKWKELSKDVGIHGRKVQEIQSVIDSCYI